jgi:hypothetical protein
MAEREHTGGTMVLVGGAALAAWLLSRGKGWGFGRSGGGIGGTRPASHCKVWIYRDRLTVDGVAADLPTVISKCRAVGTAEVGATGDTITRVIQSVLKSLLAAGVRLELPMDLEHVGRSVSL